MNQTHIHLLITHLPIFGSILGAFVLAYALYTKSNHTKIAAYNIFIISAIGACIAYFTGEAAEETVEHIQGVASHMIEEHEESAIFALISLIVLGVASLGALFISLRKMFITRVVAYIVLFISIISFGIVARTGYLGGQIRHTETSDSIPQGMDDESEHDE